MSNTLKRFTSENDLIYRPTKWPFEVVNAVGYIIQTECFTDRGDTIDSGEIGGSYAHSYNPDEVNITNRITDAAIFSTVKEAMEFINKRGDRFEEGEDGNVYPRILKVRISGIVEGIAFEPIIREIKCGKKIEGVA